MRMLRSSLFLITLLLTLPLARQAYAQLPAPSLSNPPNNAIDISKTQQNFNWSDVNGATVYRVVVSTTSSFSGFNESTNSCSSSCKTATSSYSGYPGFSLTANTKYYWRVRAGNNNSGGYWSATRSFTTEYDQFPAPTLYSPSNGATGVSKSQQNFNWSSVSGANSYRIVVSENSSFSAFVENGGSSYCNSGCWTTTTGSSSYSGFNLAAGKTYYWRVRAGNTNTQSGGYWSSARSFTTAPDNTNTPPSGNISSPSGTVSGNLTVSASGSDADGLKKVSIVFVPNGTPLVLCQDGTSNPCSGTNGSWTKTNVDPTAYGVSGAGNYTLGLHIQDDLNGNTQTLAATKSINWSPGNSNATPSGSFNSPASGPVSGNFTVSVTGTDSDGLKKVSVVFVPNGNPLVMCEDGTSNPCSGTSGSWTKTNVDPTAYGVSGAGNYTLGLHIQDELDGNNASVPVATSNISWSEGTTNNPYLNVSPWAQDAADFVVQNGIVDDPPDHDLRGTSPVNRAELATMIYRALGGGKGNADSSFDSWYDGIPPSPFSDVGDGTVWYYKAAVYLGHLFYEEDSQSVTVFDQGDGIFRAPNPISRAWSVKALLEAWNIAPLENFSGVTLFNDVPTSHPAAPYIYKAQSLGVVTGDNGNFNPDTDANREDIFVMLHRLMDSQANALNQSIALPTPLERSDFTPRRFVREIGSRYEQPILAGVDVPTISITAGNLTKENIGSFENVYTVDLTANISNLDAGTHTDSDGNPHTANPFASWRASAGSFIDLTPPNGIPFSQVKWIAPVDFSPFNGSASEFFITLYVGDNLGNEVREFYSILIDNEPAISPITPTVSVDALPSGKIGGQVMEIGGTAQDGSNGSEDADQGVLQVAVSYSVNGGQDWIPIGETGVDEQGNWKVKWSIPDFYGPVSVQAAAMNNRGNHGTSSPKNTTIMQRLAIVGTVTDGNGSLLVNASVVLTGGGLNESAITDNYGTFLFSNDQGINLQKGIFYDLSVSSAVGNGGVSGIELTTEHPRAYESIRIDNPGLDNIPPVSTASVPGGTYSSAIVVDLACSDNESGCAQTYYTIDGSTPTTNSNVYSTPISISTDTTLQFFSVDNESNAEAVKAEVYTFNSGGGTNDGDGDGVPDNVDACAGTPFGEVVNPQGCACSQINLVQHDCPEDVCQGTTRVDYPVDGSDSCSNGVVTAYSCTPTQTANSPQCSVDSDGDGVPDDVESNELGTDPQLADTDGDGFADKEDTCPLLSNAKQCEDSICPNGDCSACCTNCAPALPSESCATCATVLGMSGAWSGEGEENITLHNGTSVTLGVVGQAFSFDGVDDYASISHQENLNPGAGSFTVEFWIKTNDVNAQTVLRKEEGSKLWGVSISSNGKAVYTVQDGQGGSVSFEGQALLNNEVWHHVAMVVDRSEGLLKAYVDGQADHFEQWADLSSVGAIAPQGDLIFSSTGAEVFSGALDEVALYPQALSQQTILSIVDAYGGGKCSLPASVSQVVKFLFNEGGGCYTQDQDQAILASFYPDCESGPAWVGEGVDNSSALYFDGLDDFLQIADNLLLNPGGGSFSMSVWVQPQLVAPGVVALVVKGNPGEDYYLLGLQNGQVFLQIGANTSTIKLLTMQDGSPLQVLGTQTVQSGTWYHLVYVMDRDQQSVRLYYDGERDQTAAFNVSGELNPSGAVTISPQGARFQGMMDDMIFYPWALSDDDVKALYQSYDFGLTQEQGSTSSTTQEGTPVGSPILPVSGSGCALSATAVSWWFHGFGFLSLGGILLGWAFWRRRK